MVDLEGVIIPLIGTGAMVGIYLVSRSKKNEDTTLLNNADIKNIINQNKELKDDMKLALKELTDLNSKVTIHEYELKRLQDEIIKNHEEERRRISYRNDEYKQGGHKGSAV